MLGSLIDRGVHITSYGAAGRQGIVSRLDVGNIGTDARMQSPILRTWEMRRKLAEHEVVKTLSRTPCRAIPKKATIEAPIDAKVSGLPLRDTGR